jgi:predicted nucleotidyltransferase
MLVIVPAGVPDSRLPQLEQRDLRPDVEAYANEMTDASVDVEPPSAGKRELSSRVETVLDGEQRRWKKWRFALTAVGMP